MRAIISIGAGLALLPSSGFAWECTYPETTDTGDYETIDLNLLLADEQYEYLQGAITDVVLEVESSIINLDQLRDGNLINFIDALWAPEGNDIREVWNYFAALPPTERPFYGDTSYAPSNFRYPNGDQWEWVEIRLRSGTGGSAGGDEYCNRVTLGVADANNSIGDDWWQGEKVPAMFCHEFRHTLRHCLGLEPTVLFRLIVRYL